MRKPLAEPHRLRGFSVSTTSGKLIPTPPKIVTTHSTKEESDE